MKGEKMKTKNIISTMNLVEKKIKQMWYDFNRNGNTSQRFKI